MTERLNGRLTNRSDRICSNTVHSVVRKKQLSHEAKFLTTLSGWALSIVASWGDTGNCSGCPLQSMVFIHIFVSNLVMCSPIGGFSYGLFKVQRPSHVLKFISVLSLQSSPSSWTYHKMQTACESIERHVDALMACWISNIPPPTWADCVSAFLNVHEADLIWSRRTHFQRCTENKR